MLTRAHHPERCPDCGEELPICDCVIAWGVGEPGRDRARYLRERHEDSRKSRSDYASGSDASPIS
jgi:hypothetical protein